MGDKQHAHIQLPLQFTQQRQNLRLHRHIQCSGRLIGNQQLRLGQQRHGDHHPLAFPAGKLVGEIVEPGSRLTDTDPIKHAENLTTCRRTTQPAMQRQHFIQLLLHGVQRIQRYHRLLKNHCDLVAANRPQSLLARAQQFFTVKQNLSAGINHRRLMQQSHYRQRRDAFAGTRLTHQRQRFARVNAQ